MQLNLSGHHVDVTDSMREYVQTKLNRVERLFDQVTDINCVLTVDKLQHRAEATVNVAGAQLHANATEDNMYAAIDMLIDKLGSQLRKHKEKVTDHQARKVDKRVVS
ncbi:MAG: ribosome-associated translation inhibitor RaiA [Gammaproteobacteria bacterium PRO9]|nr:ribosome-associated translation inhibitor RaiA [Gammaproteobacteria bacterium PRO9]